LPTYHGLIHGLHKVRRPDSVRATDQAPRQRFSAAEKFGYYPPARKQRGNLTGTSGSLYMLCALHALGVTSYQ